ncbi:MAG: aminotransferase class III-fold pyridoxal phosphate-dependent enzyme, partial [Planctomycetota bacterium]
MPTESQISTARQHVDQVLQRLCGMRLADLDAESTFLELGFDSLFLIQFAQRLKAQSGVKVSFRQLIEDISTPLALTEFLAGQVSAADAIPSDAPPASSPAGPSGDARPGDHGAVPSVAASCQQYADSVPQQSRGVETSAPATQPRTPIDTGGLDPRRAALAQIIAQQNELMALQLQLLSGASMSKATPRSLPDISHLADTPSRAAATPAQAAVAGRSTDAASAAASPSTGAPATADLAVSVAAATPANSPLPSEKGQQLSRKPDKHFERFGPYKPVRKSSDGSLTASQRAHLDAFIERFTRKTAGSRRLAEQHRRHFADPRGVAAYRRIWKAMVYQIAVDKSQGARLWDIDGNEYIDIAMGFGLNLFGHSPEFIRRRIHQQLDRGVEIGPQFPLAGEVAALLCALTGMDRATFCNTGSEAVMAAMRVARTVTGKPKVVYFNKDYHGNFDEVLLRSTAMGDRHVTQPAAPGIPDALCETMVVLPYGRPESLLAIAEQADDIAAVLVEPVQSADPFLQPREFLIELRELTRQRDIALIMDEVITGFRTAAGGAQEHFGVRADLATYGKILGGGLPIGALAGSSRFMDALDGGSWQYDDASEPTADMTFFAGTFVRHPLAIVAAHEVLMRIKEESPQLQRALTQRTQRLAQRLNTFFESEQFPIRVAQFASLFRLMFPPDLEFPDLLYFHLLDRGIFTRGWGDNCFLSTEHSDADVESIVAAVEDSCRELRRAGFFHDPVASFATAAAGVMDSGQQLGGQHSRRGTDVVDEPLQRDALSRPELSDEGDSDPFAPFPLTEMQQEILMTSKVSPLAAAANNEPFALHLHGAVDIDLLRRSIRHVLARHPALRLQVDVANGLQRILPEVEFPIREHDLRALDDAARSDTFHRLAVELAATCVDASAEPLVRVEILRMADDHTAVLFDGHHIASDGWSWNILLEEIGATYSAGVAGRSPQLPEPASFRQWVLDGGRRASQEAEDLQYWAEQFADPPPPLELPTLRPRPKRQEYAASSVSMEIPQEIVQRIAALATHLQVSPSSVALAAWKLLLARLSGQHDIVVGIRTAQQALLENPHLVGLCMSVLPVRTQVRFDASAADLIRAVHGRQMDAIEHQQCDLGRIVRHVRPPRHPGHMPLTDMHFNFFRDSSNITFAGLQHQIRVTPKAAINHDLFLNVTDTGDAWVIDADFRTDLYDAVTVRAWLEHYCAILDSMAQSPDAPVGRTALYRDANLERVLNAWNSRQVDYPRDHCVTDLVAAQSQRSPDAVAIACGGEQQTYQQIEAASNRLARLLLQRGVRPGDYVGVLVERTPRMLVATLAVMKAGAAYVPMDAEFPDERLEFMCRDAEVKLAITDSAYQDRPC